MENDNQIIKDKLKCLKEIINAEINTFYPKSKKMIHDILEETQLCKSFSMILQFLVEMSIILTIHPRRLIKKGTTSQPGTQFEATISCILESSNIDIVITQIQPSLVNFTSKGEKQIKEITFKEEKLEKYQWKLKNMRFKSTDNKRSSKRITFEKSVILFDIKLNIKTSQFMISLSKMLYSKTVVVIVHSNQEPEAQLTLFVDDYFRNDNRSFIEGLGFPDFGTTSHDQLIHYISVYFEQETGRGLTKSNCDYLLSKVLNVFQTESIKLINFIKKPLPKSKLSFGLLIMVLVRLCNTCHIRDLWFNGLIDGFISKDVENILKEKGTFLLRFSERQSGIGVVLKAEDNTINAWTPFTDTECRKMNLSNHLYCFQSLKTIRKADGTCMSKYEALSKYMDVKNIDDGYTERGSSISAQVSLEDEMFNDTPFTYDLENMSDDMSLDHAEDDIDINDLLDTCTSLLNET